MIHLLVDVVSKNGNLLLNIPLPGHGRPDDDEFAFLDKFGAWMALNSEAIYSTRPWKILGKARRRAAVRCMVAAVRNLSPAISGLRPKETRYTR